jgi:hypothetical protein
MAGIICDTIFMVDYAWGKLRARENFKKVVNILGRGWRQNERPGQKALGGRSRQRAGATAWRQAGASTQRDNACGRGLLELADWLRLAAQTRPRLCRPDTSFLRGSGQRVWWNSRRRGAVKVSRVSTAARGSEGGWLASNTPSSGTIIIMSAIEIPPERLQVRIVERRQLDSVPAFFNDVAQPRRRLTGSLLGSSFNQRAKREFRAVPP